MKPTPASHPLEQFLAESIQRAVTAANFCIAVHRGTFPSLTAAEWRQLDNACERWLARRETLPAHRRAA